jgi:hypothetical protein
MVASGQYLPKVSIDDVIPYEELLTTAKAADQHVIIFQKDNHGHIGFSVGKVDKVDSSHLGDVSFIKVTISSSVDPKTALLAFTDELVENRFLSREDIVKAVLGKAQKMDEFIYGPFQDGVTVMKSFTEKELLESGRKNTEALNLWLERWKQAGVVMYQGRENVPKYPFGKLS